MVINSPCLTDKKELAIPGQTTTGKEFSNPLMADSLPKTILPTKQSATVRNNSMMENNRLLFQQFEWQTIAITEASVRQTSPIKADARCEHIPLYNSCRFIDHPGQGKGPTLPVDFPDAHPMASPIQMLLNEKKKLFKQHKKTYVAPSLTQKLFSIMKRGFSGEHIPLFDSMLIHDQPGQGEGPTLTVESQHTPIASPTTSQPTTSQPILEDDLKQAKKVYGKALTKLVKKVKHLEAKLKSTSGRITETEYEEVEYELDHTDTLQQITPTKVSQGEEQSQESSEVQLDVLNAAKILADASRERVKTYKSYTRRRRSTISLRDSTAGGLFSTAKEILIQERQSDTIKRYETLKKKPVSVAQARKNMMIYLKNMAGYKMGYFKGMSYDEIRPMFEEEYNKIQTLFKKDIEVEKTKTKRVAEETLLQESFKKLRTAEASSSKPIQEQPTEERKELSEEELKKMLKIVPVEEIKAEALQVKYPIIEWEIHTVGSRKYWKIIRVRNITEAYQFFEDMLKGFDREDLVTLWRLVKERFRSAEPTEDTERALWVELKRLVEPDKDDVLWKLQKYMHNPLTWRLYDTCGVHHVSSTRGHHHLSEYI
ncbi:hypothetical protein Tco_0752015 [Tanacetum coccineum]|uniref:Uncharacterized protein n=1 Tax=Tanacetum coccineum TaxID=301880 RepID=A0ABQ4Z5S0_9ASTR